MKCDVQGKTCHATKQAAHKHRRNLERRGGLTGGMVYKCEHCKQYHISKSKKVWVTSQKTAEKGNLMKADLFEIYQQANRDMI